MTSYVNPFGGYAQGYAQGNQMENQNQLDARRARQEDWQAKYMNPDLAAESHLQLGYNQAAEPWREKALPVGYGTAVADEQGRQLGVASGITAASGEAEPFRQFYAGLGQGPLATSSDDIVGEARMPQAIQLAQARSMAAYRQGMGYDAYGRLLTGQQNADAHTAAVANRAPATAQFDPSWLGAPTVPGAAPVPAIHPATAQALSGMPPEYAAHAIHLASQVSGHHPAAVHAAVVGALPTAPAPAATAPPAAASTNFTTDTGP